MTGTGTAPRSGSRGPTLSSDGVDRHGQPTVSELLHEALELFDEPSSAARRELRLLMSHQLARDEAWILAHGDARVGEADAQSFLSLASRRRHAEPVAYLLQEREFFGRTFICDERALIPRPETELLVDHALSLALPEQAHILDIGTGTGCIAVSLLCERPGWRATAIDVSIGALALARSNAQNLEVHERLELVASDLTAALRPLATIGFDLIVSNPPYVPTTDAALLAKDVRDYEPHQALFDPSGFGIYEKLFPLIATQPAPALFEIGFEQSRTLVELAAGMSLDVTTIIEDLAGIPRVLHVEPC